MCTRCGCQKQAKDAPAPAYAERLAATESIDHPGSASGAMSRRRAVAGTAGLGAGAVLLAACGSSDSGSSSQTLTENDGRPAQPTDMAAAADVPVGGVIQANKDGVTAMITQPVEGTFHAFSSVCTHQGCQLNAQKEQTISCPCHASVFSLEDGSVQGGPAETPLPEFTVEVKDGRIWVS